MRHKRISQNIERCRSSLSWKQLFVNHNCRSEKNGVLEAIGGGTGGERDEMKSY